MMYDCEWLRLKQILEVVTLFVRKKHWHEQGVCLPGLARILKECLQYWIIGAFKCIGRLYIQDTGGIEFKDSACNLACLADELATLSPVI